MYKLDLDNAQKPEIKLPISARSEKKELSYTLGGNCATMEI